jgi:hypothetical protein
MLLHIVPIAAYYQYCAYYAFFAYCCRTVQNSYIDSLRHWDTGALVCFVSVLKEYKSLRTWKAMCEVKCWRRLYFSVLEEYQGPRKAGHILHVLHILHIMHVLHVLQHYILLSDLFLLNFCILVARVDRCQSQADHHRVLAQRNCTNVVCHSSVQHTRTTPSRQGLYRSTCEESQRFCRGCRDKTKDSSDGCRWWYVNS